MPPRKRGPRALGGKDPWPPLAVATGEESPTQSRGNSEGVSASLWRPLQPPKAGTKSPAVWEGGLRPPLPHLDLTQAWRVTRRMK